jgi:hypothetical protein
VAQSKRIGIIHDSGDEPPSFEARIQPSPADIQVALTRNVPKAPDAVVVKIMRKGHELLAIRHVLSEEPTTISAAAALQRDSPSAKVPFQGYLDIQVIGCHQLDLTLYGRDVMYLTTAG